MDKLTQAMALLDEGRRVVWDNLTNRLKWAESVGRFMDELASGVSRCICGATTSTTHEEDCPQAPALCEKCRARPVYQACASCKGQFCDEHIVMGNDDVDLCEGCTLAAATEDTWDTRDL